MNRKKIMLHLLAFFIGMFLSGFLLFQILFLAKVIPHGGI